MATDTQIREIEERLSNAIAGWMPKNARRSAEEGHVHGSGGMGPITGALGFLYKPGVAGGQIAHGDSAADGTLTLYGGTTHGSTLSRIILGSDPKFATAANVWRNAADQVLWQQVSGSDASIFPGIIHANATVNIGTFAGSQVVLQRTGSSWNALTFNEALQARTDSAAANVNDPIIRDRTGAVRLQVNSLPTSPSGHIRVNGDFSAAGSKAGNLLVFEHKTNAILVKGTVGALTKTGTGTGVVILPPFDYTATAGNKNYRVEIDSGGTEFTATYRWSDDGGGTWQQSMQPLSGVGWYDLGATGVAFAINDSGGTFDLGDRWDWVVIGTTNQVELLRADTTTDTLHLRHIDVSATTSIYDRSLTGLFTYNGVSSEVQALNYTLEFAGSSVDSGVFAAFIQVKAASAANGLNMAALALSVETKAAQTGTVTNAVGLEIYGGGWTGSKPSFAYGIAINDLGHASVGTLAALEIRAQTAAGVTFNIRQMGTTGMNRYAAPSVFGDDSTSPAAGYAVHVVGDQCISSQLVVGATSAAVANVALQLVGGRLRMAATTNDYIEDSAGNRHLTFASSATAVVATSTFATSLRVNGTLGIGQVVPTTNRLAVSTFPNLGAGSHNLINVALTGIQSANATAKRGFGFSSQWDINGKTLGSFVGVYSAPGIDDAAGGGLLDKYAAFQGGFSSQGLSPAITDSAVFWALAPVNSGGAITTHRGGYIENQGITGIAISVGLEIATQSGADTESIGLRLNGNFMEGTEMTAPAAPAANNYRVWAQDNGSGKTQLMVEFSSGGALQLAIQP